MEKDCPFAGMSEDGYGVHCGDWCQLYQEKEKVCTLQSIDNKLSLIANFTQNLSNLTKTIESIDSWLEIMANLMKEK
jgi:predicted secreted Zn-dependent protease